MAVTSDDAKNPLDQAVEVLVYLPVGFVLEMPASIPRFIDRGRRQFEQAREIGLETLRLGNRDVSRHLHRAHEHTNATLRALGVVPPSAADGPSVDEPTPPPPTLSVVGTNGSSPDTEVGAAPTRTRAPRSPRPDPGIDPADLAIPGYDSLSASQVVPRLDGLTSDELETVRTYEQASRGRKTILSKIAQLQAS